MLNEQHLRRCFIIGPMKIKGRLDQLRDNIISPLLDQYKFRFITPEDGDIGAVMNHVLLNLEQADLLIADLSGNNSNVMYELGIYHSFGKPYVVLRDVSYPDYQDTTTPFDIASYRYVEVNLNDPEKSKEVLKPRLDRIVEQIDKRDWFSNPVTDFYQSPVAEIPTAVGLSKNYIKNFLQMLLPDIFRKIDDEERYLLKVAIDDPEYAGPDFRLLTFSEMNKLTFEILIPVRMAMSEHEFITNIKQQNGGFKYRPAKVFRQTRPFNLHYRKDENGDIVLADVPTVLSTLNESIMNRRNIHNALVEAEEWKILEIQELERFASKCELFAYGLLDKNPFIKGRINVVWRWDPR